MASYGISPTLNDPSNVEAISDVRTASGAARCCQFFTDLLPPGWYFFSKSIKTYTNNKLGISVTPHGNWKSSLTGIKAATLPTLTDAPKGFEVVTATVPICYEFDTTLAVVGGVTLTGVIGSPVSQIAPSFIGQTCLDDTDIVWVSVGLTDSDWIQIADGNAT